MSRYASTSPLPYMGKKRRHFGLPLHYYRIMEFRRYMIDHLKIDVAKEERRIREQKLGCPTYSPINSDCTRGSHIRTGQNTSLVVFNFHKVSIINIDTKIGRATNFWEK